MNERQSIRKKSRKKTNKYHKSYFLKLRKKIYEMTIRKKYGNPYIIKEIPKDNNEIIEKEEIPKYYDLYKINKLINKVKCRLYSNYIDIKLFFSPNEYLNDFYNKFLSNVLIKYNIYNICTFNPNYFPLEEDFQSHLFLYLSKIKSINEKKIKGALGQKEEKKQTFKIFNNPYEYSNILKSMIQEETPSENHSNYLELNLNVNQEKKKKKKNENNEINDMQNIIVKISKIEIEKAKKEKEKREQERKKKREEEKLLRKKFKETQKEIKRQKIKKLESEQSPSSILLKTFRRKSTIQIYSKKKNIQLEIKPKFKQTIDFIGGKREKEKLQMKKHYLIEKMVEVSKFKKKNISGINYLKKIQSGSYKNIPDSLIGINDFSESQKNISVLKDTQKYLKKVHSTLSNERNHMRKSYTLKKIIKCPNIYTDNYENNKSFNIKRYYLNIKKINN